MQNGNKLNADQLLKTCPQLNKKYPTPRKKDRTYLVDFQNIEAKAGASLLRKQCLNGFERVIYESICTDDNQIFEYKLGVALETLTDKQRFVFQKRMESYTQNEIANIMNISRNSVIKHLIFIRKKLKKSMEKS